jgi:hypothetical protein
MSLQEIKNLSIEEYLQSQGFQIQPKSKYLCCKSPFSRDSNWSLVIYQQTNSFYDWSTGFGGSIIDLAMAMHALSFPQAVEHLQNGNLKPYQRNYKVTRPLVTKDFEYTRYLTTDVTEIEAIRSYAESRGLRNGFEYGFYFVHNDGNFIRKPSVMFIHRDSTNKITGVKFMLIHQIMVILFYLWLRVKVMPTHYGSTIKTFVRIVSLYLLVVSVIYLLLCLVSTIIYQIVVLSLITMVILNCIPRDLRSINTTI